MLLIWAAWVLEPANDLKWPVADLWSNCRFRIQTWRPRGGPSWRRSGARRRSSNRKSRRAFRNRNVDSWKRNWWRENRWKRKRRRRQQRENCCEPCTYKFYYCVIFSYLCWISYHKNICSTWQPLLIQFNKEQPCCDETSLQIRLIASNRYLHHIELSRPFI